MQLVKRRKPPRERLMLCTDIKVNAGAPECAFIDAWNKLVDEGMDCTDSKTDDILTRYRRRELKSLLEEIGYIDEVPHELIRRTLEHIEVKPDGSLGVFFLAGVKG